MDQDEDGARVMNAKDLARMMGAVKIGKAKKTKAVDAPMVAPKISVRSKAIKKKEQVKKSKKILQW